MKKKVIAIIALRTSCLERVQVEKKITKASNLSKNAMLLVLVIGAVICYIYLSIIDLPTYYRISYNYLFICLSIFHYTVQHIVYLSLCLLSIFHHGETLCYIYLSFYQCASWSSVFIYPFIHLPPI